MATEWQAQWSGRVPKTYCFRRRVGVQQQHAAVALEGSSGGGRLCYPAAQSMNIFLCTGQ